MIMEIIILTKRLKIILKNIMENLDDNGEISITYSQKENIGRYYSDKFCLQNMFNEVRTSIIDRKCTDVDFINSNITIILYLAKKHTLKIPNIIKYANDRESILKQIGNDTKTSKKLILAILTEVINQNITMMEI